MLYDTTRIPSGAGAALMTEQLSKHSSGSSPIQPPAFQLPTASATTLETRYVSPALASSQSRGAEAAYEVKCLIPQSLAEELERTLGSRMLVDPFAAKENDGQYRITTLSTDTEARDCFHRSPGYAKRKYRLRRYGSESRLYLEQKTRRGQRVNKRRVATTESELQSVFALARCMQQAECKSTTSIQNVADEETLWDLHMFQNRIDSLNLRPVCLMSYQRRAWFAETESGPVRWTLDRSLVGAEWTQWSIDSCSELKPILQDDQVICEFKFSGGMPSLFKQVVHDYQITPGGFSKYRNCMSKLTGLALPTATPCNPDGSGDVSDKSNPDRGLSHD